MPNREKVIMAIEICIKSGCKDGIPNKLCPYSSEVGCDLNQILADALELLKEQEDLGTELTNAVELIHKKNERIEKLLKEQETQKFFVDESGKITPLPVVVRCKDCKHRPKEPNFETYESGFDLEFPEGSKCPCRCYGDEWYSWYPVDDWFCADGERKEGR